MIMRRREIEVALAANSKWRTIKFEVNARDGNEEVFGEVAASGLLVRQEDASQEEIQTNAKTVEGLEGVDVNLLRFPEFAEPSSDLPARPARRRLHWVGGANKPFSSCRSWEKRKSGGGRNRRGRWRSYSRFSSS